MKKIAFSNATRAPSQGAGDWNNKSGKPAARLNRHQDSHPLGIRSDSVPRRADTGFSMCRFCTYCRRWKNLPDALLQPGRDHFRGLSCQIPTRRAVPPVGHSNPQTTPDPGIHPQPQMPGPTPNHKPGRRPQPKTKPKVTTWLAKP